jgi:hypothetical protein
MFVLGVLLTSLTVSGCDEDDESPSTPRRPASTAPTLPTPPIVPTPAYDVVPSTAADDGGPDAEVPPGSDAPGATNGSESTEVTYPAPCGRVQAASHAALSSDAGTDSLCVPASPAAVSLLAARQSPDVPSGYSDDNDFALLSGPSSVAEETSNLSRSDRSSAAAAIRSRVYRLEHPASECEFTWTEAVQRLSVSCPIGSWGFYASRQPSLSRTQHCETESSDRCTDTCTSHSDCNGWTCGCPESRCVFFRCTGCPSERVCEEPEFNLTQETWRGSVSLTDPADVEMARQLATSQTGLKVMMTFSPTSVFRNIRTKRACEDEEIEDEGGDEDEEGESRVRTRRRCHNEVEHDTGMVVGIRMLSMFVYRCDNSACRPWQVGRGLELLRGVTWRTTAPNLGAATCTRGRCTWSGVGQGAAARR